MNLEFSEAIYRALPTDQIMLARRNAEWRESDPRQIEDWFLEAIAEHGEVVRRVCRYLKGWRDYQLEKSKISSLLLMTCVVATFDSLRGSLPTTVMILLSCRPHVRCRHNFWVRSQIRFSATKF